MDSCRRMKSYLFFQYAVRLKLLTCYGVNATAVIAGSNWATRPSPLGRGLFNRRTSLLRQVCSKGRRLSLLAPSFRLKSSSFTRVIPEPATVSARSFMQNAHRRNKTLSLSVPLSAVISLVVGRSEITHTDTTYIKTAIQNDQRCRAFHLACAAGRGSRCVLTSVR